MLMLLRLAAEGRGAGPGCLAEGFAEMELVGIACLFPYLPDSQVCVQQKIPGLMDAYVREIFQRGAAFVFIEQFCQVGGTEAKLLGEDAEIHIIHIVLL